MISGKELYNRYDNIQNNEFATNDKMFELVYVDKIMLYPASPPFCSAKNLRTFDEWLIDEDNYDFYHTDTIYDMIKCLIKGEELPPIIIDKNLGLYDGQHRLTAYSMIDKIQCILCYKEV